jgi:hypothetical protein
MVEGLQRGLRAGKCMMANIGPGPPLPLLVFDYALVSNLVTMTHNITYIQ